MKKSILTILVTITLISFIVSSVSAAIIAPPISEEIEPNYLVDHSINAYYLRNAKSKMYLDLQASGTTNGTHFQQYPLGDASEVFKITYASGGSAVIQTTLPYASGTKLMSVDSSCDSGSQVYLYDSSTSKIQSWIVIENSNGSYSLCPEGKPNLCVAIAGSSTSSNAKVKLADKNSADLSQQWFISTVPDEIGLNTGMIYYVRNKASGKYLDLQGNGTTSGTHFQQYTFGTNGYPSEQFKLIFNSNGYYTVRSQLATTNMVMDGRSNCVDGAQVILYGYNSSLLEQRWHFRLNDDGTFCISPAKNVYLNLAVQGSSTANNAKVILSDRDYTADNQKWYLEPIDAENFDFQYMFEDEDEFSWIWSGYKDPNRSNHYAIDIIGLSGNGNINLQPIYSPVSGKVVCYWDNHGESGRYLVIETDTCWPGTGKKLRLTFAHMSSDSNYSITHTVGDRICVGDLIGYVGDTGNAEGYHLHHAIYMPDEDEDWEVNETVAARFNPMYFYPYVSFFFYSTVHSTDFN